jgi:transcriptional regulator with XRE-family HTH domain
MNLPANLIMNQEVSKFSPLTVNVKRNIRRLRLQKGYSMNEGASLLEISRKQLEDIETVRNYGCHLDLELLAKIKVIYGVSLDEIFGELPSDYYSDYYNRPRRKFKDDL